jgi:8-oxo-dGTP pyrophosphatase MutT (NUDIX family)
MERHLTVSGFVVHEGHVALYWHRKLGMWLPSGGHIEANEDPVQTTLRELREEFQIEAEILPLSRRFDYSGGPEQLEAPHAMIDCWANDHWHVDFVYFCRLLTGYPGVSEDPENPIVWMDIEALQRGSHPRNGASVRFAPDVQALAIQAIHAANTLTSATAGQPPRTLSSPSPWTERGLGGEVAFP